MGQFIQAPAKGARYWKIYFCILCGLAAWSTGASASLLFSDDFSSGDMSRHNAQFRWGDGQVRGPGTGSDVIDRISGPNGTTVSARRFRYGTWQEQRFHLTSSANEARSPNGQSNVAHPEVWVSYWMRVPQNYYHRSVNGSAGHNNKGWLYLWKDAYEKWHSSWTDESTVTPTSMSLHWWPSDPVGSTRVTVVASRYRQNWGNRANMTFVKPERQIPGASAGRSFAFLPSEFGKWVHFTFGMKVASKEGAKDGFARIYVNGELAMAMENLDSGGKGSQNGFDRGYIMGYHNSGYDQTTTYYITDFRIGTTRAAVMNDALGKTPSPPLLNRVD
jgi:hypothetical protein